MYQSKSGGNVKCILAGLSVPIWMWYKEPASNGKAQWNQKRAERYYLQNGSLADIHFIPQISLEASFSGCYIFIVLEYGEQAAEKIARQWIKRNIPYISQQRILYGCVRDEFREILDTPNDRIHKIKHLIQALNETRHKAVQVILCRKRKLFKWICR